MWRGGFVYNEHLPTDVTIRLISPGSHFPVPSQSFGAFGLLSPIITPGVEGLGYFFLFSLRFPSIVSFLSFSVLSIFLSFFFFFFFTLFFFFLFALAMYIHFLFFLWESEGFLLLRDFLIVGSRCHFKMFIIYQVFLELSLQLVTYGKFFSLFFFFFFFNVVAGIDLEGYIRSREHGLELPEHYQLWVSCNLLFYPLKLLGTSKYHYSLYIYIYILPKSQQASLAPETLVCSQNGMSINETGVSLEDSLEQTIWARNITCSGRERLISMEGRWHQRREGTGREIFLPEYIEYYIEYIPSLMPPEAKEKSCFSLPLLHGVPVFRI